jgi:predicted membrane metal-binding protein
MQPATERVLSALACALLGFWLGGAACRAAPAGPACRASGKAVMCKSSASLPRCRTPSSAASASNSLSRRSKRRAPSCRGGYMLSWYHGGLEDEWRERLAIRPAERWRFTVRLKRPHGNANPHGFDYEAWLFERGSAGNGLCASARRRAASGRLRRAAWLRHRALRDRIRRSFRRGAGEAPYVGILAALAIGDQQAIPGRAVAPVQADRGDAPDVDLRPACDDGCGAVCRSGRLELAAQRAADALPAGAESGDRRRLAGRTAATRCSPVSPCRRSGRCTC